MRLSHCNLFCNFTYNIVEKQRRQTLQSFGENQLFSPPIKN